MLFVVEQSICLWFDIGNYFNFILYGGRMCARVFSCLCVRVSECGLIQLKWWSCTQREWVNSKPIKFWQIYIDMHVCIHNGKKSGKMKAIKKDPTKKENCSDMFALPYAHVEKKTVGVMVSIRAFCSFCNTVKSVQKCVLAFARASVCELHEARRANIAVVLHSNDFNFMQTMDERLCMLMLMLICDVHWCHHICRFHCSKTLNTPIASVCAHCYWIGYIFFRWHYFFVCFFRMCMAINICVVVFLFISCFEITGQFT